MFSSSHPYDFSSIDGRIFQACLYCYIVGIPLTNGAIAFMLIFRKHLRKIANLYLIFLSLSESVGGMIIISSMLDEMNGVDMSLGHCTFVLYLEHFALMCGTFSLVSIAIDRYRTVFDPQSYKPTFKRTLVTISLVIVSAAIFSLVIFVDHMMPNSKKENVNETAFDERICSTFLEDENGNIALSVFDCVAGFLLPMLVMAIMYIKIIKRLWADDMIMASLTSTQKIRKATKLSLSCTLLFFIFWFPYQITEIIHDIFEMYPNVISEDIEDVVDRIKHGTMLLVLTKSFISPVVYGFFSLALKTEIWLFFRKLNGCTSRSNKINDVAIEITHIQSFSDKDEFDRKQ